VRETWSTRAAIKHNNKKKSIFGSMPKNLARKQQQMYSMYPLRAKLWCALQLKGQINSFCLSYTLNSPLWLDLWYYMMMCDPGPACPPPAWSGLLRVSWYQSSTSDGVSPTPLRYTFIFSLNVNVREMILAYCPKWIYTVGIN
jgi:hypothetical protein